VTKTRSTQRPPHEQAEIVGFIAVSFAVVTLAQAADQAPLVRAARSSDLVALRALLQRHADVNQADLDGTTAARTGQVHLVSGKALFWYGPRTAPALRELRRLLASC